MQRSRLAAAAPQRASAASVAVRRPSLPLTRMPSRRFATEGKADAPLDPEEAYVASRILHRHSPPARKARLQEALKKATAAAGADGAKAADAPAEEKPVADKTGAIEETEKVTGAYHSLLARRVRHR